MWDVNKHKLKRDAVPTIFGFFLKKQSTKDENSNSINSNVNIMTNKIQSSEFTNEEIIDEVENEDVNIHTVSILKRKNSVMA